MCACQHKVHWSVVSLIVNAVCLILFTAAIATPNWAYKDGVIAVNTGLLQACTAINRTCYDTNTFFNDFSQKGALMASAVINIFATIGMWLFFTLGVFFLCGLFEEKSLATAAVIVAYVSALFALVGTIMFAVTIKTLDYGLSWSFILAVLGFIVDLAAGVLMCVGRNISRKRKTKEMLKQRRIEREIGMGLDNPAGPEVVEDVPLDELEVTKKKTVVSSGATKGPAKGANKGASNKAGGARGSSRASPKSSLKRIF